MKRMAATLQLISVLTAIATLATAVTAGNVEDEPLERSRKPADRIARRVVEGNAEFAFDLYKRLGAEAEGNLFCSPHSISTALAMTYAGARNETADEMAGTLHFPLPQARLHKAFGDLADRLGRIDAGGKDDGVELAIANRLWGQEGKTFLQPFLDATSANYGAGFETADFLADPDGSRQTINGWVAEQTRGRIKGLLKQGDVTAATRLVLTNAIYFKGDWLEQFDPKKTRDRRFFTAGESFVETPMMAMMDRFSIYESGDVQVLEMPYKGGRMAMMIVLPTKRDGLAALEEALSPAMLESWRKEANTREVRVSLPRFELGHRFDLGQTLAAMGMPSAFKAGEADFSGMTGRQDLFIGKVVHQAWVKVDEKGTEAAAATGTGMVTMSMPRSFTADHPFLFLIRDRDTGAILFMGRVVDPTKTE